VQFVGRDKAWPFPADFRFSCNASLKQAYECCRETREQQKHLITSNNKELL
jgi:hypothetical protein